MFNIGITGTGSLIGQAIIKSIIRSKYAHEYRLVGFDYFPDTAGSLWCDKSYILPDLLKPDMLKKWLESLIAIINKEQLEVLLIGVDFELPVLAENRLAIEDQTGCKVMVNRKEVIEIANDKYLTYKFLKDNNLAYPKTYLPHECDIYALEYPLVIKPRTGARSVGVYQAGNPDELNQKLARIREPVIQESVGTELEEYTCGVVGLEDGKQRSIVLKRSLKNGNTYIAEYRYDFPQVIYDYIDNITAVLKPNGACNYQLRIGNDGMPKLFEINPRHSGTTYMRSLFGFNEVIYILKLLLERKEPAFKLKEGKAMRYYEEGLV